MKKTIGKPENWQDFENLCKKLWGEIWETPNKIKKNGRLGQEQAGVDIYGVPKGEQNYWGIQAKGKDDYTHAKLLESEILSEIKKAKTFKPKLSVYIIATTSNKDSKIEEFVRLKDIENQKADSFEILLYCWEDIVDLLEEHPNVLNWYLHGIGQKGKYDFKISFNNLEDALTLNPTFEKEITRYRLSVKSDTELLLDSLNDRMGSSDLITKYPVFPFKSNKINNSWCDFKLFMENTGSMVIEDWRLVLRFKSGVARLDSGSLFFPRISFSDYVDNENKTITYRPIENKPLIQKDHRFFEISLLPDPESDKIIVEWELLARDFNRVDEFQIKIQPDYIEKVKYVDVNKATELLDDEIFISYHIVDTENKNNI